MTRGDTDWSELKRIAIEGVVLGVGVYLVLAGFGVYFALVTFR